MRVLKFRGNPVEVQNYIDDTGVQVADVVVGFQQLEKLTLDDAKRIAATTRFDYYCWDLYARVTEWYDGDKERLKIRAATLHDIEHGVDPTASLAAFIADTVVRAHLKTMARLNIDYQLLTWEGDILRLQVLGARVRGAEADRRRLPADRRQARRLLGHEDRRPGHRARLRTSRRRTRRIAEAREKVIVRSNGTGGLRRQGHGVSVLEVRAARPGLPLPQVRDAHGRRHAVGDDQRPVTGGRRRIRRSATPPPPTT